jgi:dTDP-glucose 4,6-dehydratase
MKILVTGAAGFIGSHVCERFIKAGHKVWGIDNLSRGLEINLETIWKHPNFTFIQGDAGNIKLMEDLGIQTIVHLASQKIPRYSSGWETLQENARVSNALLEFSIKKNIRLLFASTSDVYGKNPHLPYTETSDCVLGPSTIKRWAYATSKLHTEHQLIAAGRTFGLPFQIMRFFGCYGPRQAQGWWGGPHSVFMEKAAKGETLELHGDGMQTRSFIYIDDLVDGIYRLLMSDYHLPVNIGNPDEISIKDFADEILKLTGSNQKLISLPLPKDDPKQRQPDITKARAILGWEPKVNRAEGLKITYEYFKSLSKEELNKTEHRNLEALNK